MVKLKSDNKKAIQIIMILGVLFIAFSSIYLFSSITAKNAGYFLPRRAVKIITVLLVSYCVAYSSVTFQTVTNNRILTPSVMGLDSLYMFIQTIIVMFTSSGKLQMMTGYMNFAISVIAMIAFSWILFFVMFRGEQRNVYFLLLVGMVVGTLFSSLANFIQVVMDPNEFLVLQNKMFASFNNINQDLLNISIIIVVACFILTIRDNAKLDVLSLGQEHAINLGISYNRLVLKNLMITSVLVSVSTALVGPITFLGILVVSVARGMLKTYKHSYRIATTFILGATLLIGAILLVERILKFSTTISVIINFVGGCMFIYMIMKEKNQ